MKMKMFIYCLRFIWRPNGRFVNQLDGWTDREMEMVIGLRQA